MCLGIPGQIVSIVDASRRLARVEVGGVRRDVNILCITDPEQTLEDHIGEWVLVHAGFAMARIDAQEAERTLRLFSELGEVQQGLQTRPAGSGSAGNDGG